MAFVNDGIKDSKDEVVPETAFADMVGKKRYLDNVFKVEDEDDTDLSDLMKVPLGDDPLQRKWINLKVTNLVNQWMNLKRILLRKEGVNMQHLRNKEWSYQ